MQGPLSMQHSNDGVVMFKPLTNLLVHACGLALGQRPESRKVVLPLLHQQCKAADSRSLHSMLTLL